MVAGAVQLGSHRLSVAEPFTVVITCSVNFARVVQSGIAAEAEAEVALRTVTTSLRPQEIILLLLSGVRLRQAVLPVTFMGY